MVWQTLVATQYMHWMMTNVIVNPIVGDLGPWPEGKLHGEHEGIRSPDNTPYHPFWVTGNSKFMEVTLAASLNQVHVDKLLDLISCVAQGMAQVTLKNNVELCKACDATAAQLMPFSKHDVTTLYKKQDQMYEVFMHPVWEQALNKLLENKLLAPHFVWDAQHLYKYSEEGFKHFYDEPWMVDHWWDIQQRDSQLLYGLSYDDAFYRFLRILKRRAAWATQTSSDKSGMSPLSSYSKTFPNTHKLVCLVPINELHDLAKMYPLHLMDQAQDTLSTYNYSHMAGKEWLKAIGLWPVENVFWHIRNSDPHATLSFDCLHSSHDGVGGRHALQDVKKILNELGHEAEVKVEDYISKFSQWHGLSHFKDTINVTFLDGNKKCDLEIFYACLNIFTKNWTPEGYSLLHVLTSYLELNSLISLNVHTESTIEMIEAELLRFDRALKVGLVWRGFELTGTFQKPTSGNITWPNESMHGPLKEAYEWWSNGKAVAGQNIETDHSQTDRAFIELCKKLSTFCNKSLMSYGYQVQKWIVIHPNLKIWEYKYLKVNYESLVNWKLTTDHLQCNLMFFGVPQYDCAIVQLTEVDTAFIHLICIFSCKPFTVKMGATHQIDHNLQLTHVKAVHHSNMILIPIQSIIWGAVLVPNPSHISTEICNSMTQAVHKYMCHLQ
ncbi:hypothetical protein EDC04DRAFT_2603975 [Pisolithus marmoratus]|nr:hypothetical protein EDC04DRAFT_2603975 [Pisolithus marmoratus]